MASHPLIAGLLSALVPGAGQLYARKPLRALIFFLPTLIVVYSGYEFASQGSVGMAALLVRPSFLSGLLLFNLLILGWRIAAVVDAFLITDSTRDRTWMPITISLLLLVVTIPHLIGWSYGVQTISALEAVFVAAPADGDLVPLHVPPRSFEDTIPDPQIYRDPVEPNLDPGQNMIFTPGVGDPDAIAALGNIRAPSTPFAPFVPFEERINPERVTILLVGGDAGPGREGLRTDTMIVATFELATGRAALFSLPRNFKLVPLPPHLKRAFVGLEERVIEKDLTDLDEDGYPDAWIDTDGDGIPEEPEFESCECFPTMLNKVHQYTQDWTTSYPRSPNPGLSALRDVISNLIDLPIDYYLMVKMEGFVKAIDALGGVDVLVKDPYHVTVSSPEEGVPKASINVEPGMNHLDGLESLAYVRWRRGSSDYNRMVRQRCLIRAVVTQTDTVNLVGALPQLLDLITESVTTDIPLSMLPDLVRIAGTVDLDNVATVGFVPPTYSAGRTPMKYPIPNVSRIRSKVLDVLEKGVTAQSRTGESECG